VTVAAIDGLDQRGRVLRWISARSASLSCGSSFNIFSSAVFPVELALRGLELTDPDEAVGIDQAAVLGRHGGAREGAGRPKAGETREPKAGNQGDNITLNNRGTSRDYLLARLDRDHPELAAGPRCWAMWRQAIQADDAKEADAADRANQRAAGAPLGNTNAVKAERAQHAGAADLANQRLVGKTTVHSTENDVNNCSKRPWGNSESYAHRKLRKDRPDLHARVLAGELAAHAGMVEAGFRKPAKSR
jgi:hypothetical protein